MSWALEVGDGVASVSAGDAVVVLWRDGAAAHRIRWVRARAEARRAHHGPSVIIVQLVLPSASPPGLSELGEIRSGLQSVGPGSRCLALVPLGDGRWHGVVRHLLRAGLVVMRRSDDIRVVDTLADTHALWRRVASPATPTPELLHSGVQSLFEALRVPVPNGAR